MLLALITSAHFGANIILTRDSLKEGEAFRETLSTLR